MKKLVLALLLALPLFLTAQTSFWVDAEQPIRPGTRQYIQPEQYRLVQIQLEDLKTYLAEAPQESAVKAYQSDFELTLPTPDGQWERFRLVSSPVMAPGLKRLFPRIQTFLAKSIDHPRALARLDYTPHGFHAMVLDGERTYFIDPYYFDQPAGVYASYFKRDYAGKKDFDCHTEELATDSSNPGASSAVVGESLRVYRMAIAATGEFTQFFGNTVEDGLSGVVTALNRINVVYENDLSARMELIDSNHLIIYTDPSTDPYSGGAGAHLGQNQSNLAAVIGLDSFDIGHVFHRQGNNGVASLASVCRNNRKAQGFTAANPPIGDPLAIDYAAHEIGHQFGGNHTQNNNCNRAGNSAVEPGSASTIMGYAGICPPNLQNNSDPYFHAVNLDEMLGYTFDGFGASCANFVETGNTNPEVEAGESGLVIPISTPFELEGSAVDLEGDSLTYCWEQMDVGPAGPPSNPQGSAPLFRSFLPQPDPLRVFPRISDLVNNTTVIGELLPFYERELNFRLTVRDNFGFGGGIGFDELSLQVTEEAGPFVVLSQNQPEEWTAGTLHLVEWEVANTNQAPVNADSVMIYLSDDGGFNYPYLLADGPVPNDGKQLVILPDSLEGEAFRLKVKAANNVFFDINNQNFSIRAPQQASVSLGTEGMEQLACGGDTVRYTVRAESVLGLEGRVAIQTAGLPADLSLIAPDSIDLPTQLTVDITGTEGLATGVYPFQLIAVQDSIADTLQLSLRLFAGAPGSVDLLAPAPGELAVPINPTLVWADNPEAETYRLEVSLDPFFSSLFLQEEGLVDTTYQLQGLPDSTEVYWRVIGVNRACGGGEFSANTFFTERIVCSTFSPEDTPLDLSGPAPIVFSIIETDLDRPVRDINLTLAGSYNPIEDLSIRLNAPAGNSVVIYSGDCESGIGAFNIGIDDDAQNLLPCPLLGGVFQPEDPLRAINGTNAAGVWSVAMINSGGSGELLTWSLEVCYPDEVNSTGERSLPSQQLRVYPNPAEDQVWVELDGHTAETGRLELYSPTGQLLLVKALDGYGMERTSISTAGLPAGLYLLQLRAESGALLGYSRVVKK
jgi:hypothetical protein